MALSHPVSRRLLRQGGGIVWAAVLAVFTSGAGQAQELVFWTMERLGGPVEPVAKHALSALVILDQEARMEHEGNILRLRIPASVAETRIHQALLEATGGAFRTLHQQMAPPRVNGAALRVEDGEPFARVHDPIAQLAANVQLLHQLGAPLPSPNASEAEVEAHHALLKRWCEEHPEHHPAVLRAVKDHPQDD